MTSRKLRMYDLDHGIRMIDGYDLGMPGRTGIYVIEAEDLTLVETGPGMSVPYILKGLEEMGHAPEDVVNVIVTHIHLDHAGGAGLLLKSCPRARVVVHPRGARHLADPSRLVQGARMVYGERFDELFDPVVPIPEDRLLVKGDGDTLSIGSGRELSFMDTPGHAAHHFSIHDPVSNGIFTGDTAGVRYHQTEEFGFPFLLPSTSPNQFDPVAMRSSIERILSRKPDRIYYGHFGMTDQPEEACAQVIRELDRFVSEARTALENGEGTEGIEKRLIHHYSQELADHGVPSDHSLMQFLQLDMSVCAMGLAHAFGTNRR